MNAIAERAGAPLRVAVHGRRGVGRGTVARALARAGIGSGIQMVSPATAADLDVHVIAEVVKPEDRAAIGAARSSVLVVLNKADLTGCLSRDAGPVPTGGPIAAARTRCGHFSALVGVPVEPMIGLLAVAALDGLDDASWAALRALAAHPDGIASLEDSYDGFVTADLPVPAEVRMRVLAGLDLFGTALGIAAFRQHRTPEQVRALLRRVSGVDAVVDRVHAIGAEARYRRALDAVAELEALAVTDQSQSERIGEFLSHDDTVVARMAAALDVARAAGLDPEVAACDDPAAHLSRAARWQRYSRGPVSELHRACGADIARGSLRLWSRAVGGGGPG
ncbi:hypothetical protein MLAC_40010 [Mycobacterium lacus]|uniref:Uncharacterized protein n=1 Tax=Mycobacterium lacus TaxID=169765 RepID=A0A7I7NT53_9MYCO|nr:hypothetical protein MLAC_40010 [Mycobacterium lacus]